MPDIYERLEQLKGILRHMFEIGQELNKEVMELTARRDDLQKTNEALQTQVEQQERTLAEREAYFEKQLTDTKKEAAGQLAAKDRTIGEKQELIDNLDRKLNDLDQSLAQMREDRRKDQELQQILIDLELLQGKRQEYNNEKAKLDEIKNTLETERASLKIEREKCEKERLGLAAEKSEFENRENGYKEKLKKLNEELLRLKTESDVECPKPPFQSPAGQQGAVRPGNERQQSLNPVNSADQSQEGLRPSSVPGAPLQPDWNKFKAPADTSAGTFGNAAEPSEEAKKTEATCQPRKTRDFYK